MTDLDSIDPAFGNWLAGFVDGEGCFDIRRRNNDYVNARTGYSATFVICLRADDAPVLCEIQQKLGVGWITYRPEARDGGRGPQVRWDVAKKADCAFLVRLFDLYPLRAKKQRDFGIWRRAISVWCSHTRRDDWTEMAKLREEIKASRPYRDGFVPSPERPESFQGKLVEIG